MKHLQLIIIVLTIFTSSLIAQEDKKVAVFDPVTDVNNTIVEIVREEISSIIVNAEGYVALERQLINKVLEENKFQASGLVGESQVSEMGKVMGADYVLVTTLSAVSTNYYISCKIIEVATAHIEMQATGTTKYGTDDLITTVQTVVKLMLASKVQPTQASTKTNATKTKAKKEKSRPDSVVVTGSSVFTAQGGSVYCDGIKMDKAQVLSLLSELPGNKKRYSSGMSKRSIGRGLIGVGVALPVVGGGLGYLVKSEKTERKGNDLVQCKYNNWKTFALIGTIAGAGFIAYGIHLKSVGGKEVRRAIETFSSERKKTQPEQSLKLEIKTNGVGLSYNF